jgi:hypothetical protein
VPRLPAARDKSSCRLGISVGGGEVIVFCEEMMGVLTLIIIGFYIFFTSPSTPAFVSSELKDPGLGSGWSYFTEDPPFRRFLLTVTDQKEVRTSSRKFGRFRD